MASSDSQIDKPQHGRPKRAELPDVNINTGAQSINTERASLSLILQSDCFYRFCSSHVICLSSQSAPETDSQEKSPQTFAHLVNFSKIVFATLDNHTILLFWL